MDRASHADCDECGDRRKSVRREPSPPAEPLEPTDTDGRGDEEAGQRSEVIVMDEIVLHAIRGQRVVQRRREREQHPRRSEQREAARRDQQEREITEAVDRDVAEQLEGVLEHPHERIADRVAAVAGEPPPEGFVRASEKVHRRDGCEVPRRRSQRENRADPSPAVEEEQQPEHHVGE